MSRWFFVSFAGLIKIKMHIGNDAANEFSDEQNFYSGCVLDQKK